MYSVTKKYYAWREDYKKLNEGGGDIKSQLKLLTKLLKKTGATLEIKGSTITIDLKTGGQEGAMEFQWPRMVKEK